MAKIKVIRKRVTRSGPNGGVTEKETVLERVVFHVPAGESGGTPQRAYEMRLELGYHEVSGRGASHRRSYHVAYEVKRGKTWRFVALVGTQVPDRHDGTAKERLAKARAMLEEHRPANLPPAPQMGVQMREALPENVQAYLANVDRIPRWEETKTYAVSGTLSACFTVFVEAASARDAKEAVRADDRAALGACDEVDHIDFDTVERED